jgi:1-deoxy-D-xylulose-5-phosphate reductoisomerase
MIRKISILGSTGSIGTQSLNVIEQYADLFEVNFLSTNTNIDLLYQQIIKFRPKRVHISNSESYKIFKEKYKVDCEILNNKKDLLTLCSETDTNLLVSSLVGFAGVEPTLKAIENKIDVALANKETLVSAGSIITAAAKKHNVNIYAIDSEHNAILQCLIGEEKSSIEKIILTASGGPFRSLDKNKFGEITIKEALNHPNWSMGSKITIDSASMMNKGLEVIEAYWLFNLTPDKIDVLVHKESIIHSMVQFIDGSIKAQLGLPDMRVPISYALTYPKRYKLDVPRLDLVKINQLNFEEPDYEKFRCLKLAFEVLKDNPNKANILNAANEIAVENFLQGNIKFNDIPIVIETILNKISFNDTQNLEEIIELDTLTRTETVKFINKL